MGNEEVWRFDTSHVVVVKTGPIPLKKNLARTLNAYVSGHLKAARIANVGAVEILLDYTFYKKAGVPGKLP